MQNAGRSLLDIQQPVHQNRQNLTSPVTFPLRFSSQQASMEIIRLQHHSKVTA